MSDFITIGDKKYDIKLRAIDCENLKIRFDAHSKFAIKLLKRGIPYNITNFIYWAVWYVLDKKYIWPFTKPFRSYRKLRKQVLKGELENIKNFVSYRILDIKEPEGDEKKNKMIAQ